MIGIEKYFFNKSLSPFHRLRASINTYIQITHQRKARAFCCDDTIIVPRHFCPGGKTLSSEERNLHLISNDNDEEMKMTKKKCLEN